jgi:MFS family permease
MAGISRAYNSPANAALMPLVVSTKNFTNAVTWSSMTFQLASIAGPALGGAMIAVYHEAWPVYFIDFIANVIFALLLLVVKNRPQAANQKDMSWKTMLSGVRFVWDTKLILAAITLDMFAVLFGGAIALLPIFAKDILHAGATGLGWLQAAPSVGAVCAGFFLARMGSFRRAGTWLMVAVIGFGLSTIAFGLSKHFGLSFVLLFFAGAFDNISVVIRHALVQLRTPDEMRGRVSAINFVFIGTSNELGGFESGLVAHWFGPVRSVVIGGIATIVTVLAVAAKWPELRRMDRLEDQRPEEEALATSAM